MLMRSDPFAQSLAWDDNRFSAAARLSRDNPDICLQSANFGGNKDQKKLTRNRDEKRRSIRYAENRFLGP
jgi:hypothetical protein